MNRKITKCGFLYVAPEGIDFSNVSQRTKRWQRRWFALYDDGELSYALDQHADTVPQRVIDMTTCTEVTEAEQITGHIHSLRVTTQSNDHHYFKADSAEEIKWWRDLLCIYSKQLTRRRMRLDLANGDNNDGHKSESCIADTGSGGPTLVQVKNLPFRDRSQRRTSDPFSQAKVDVARSTECSFHGTPRSVKNRKTVRCRDDCRSKTFSEFDTSGILTDDGSAANSNNLVTLVNEDGEGDEIPQADSNTSSGWTVQLKTGKATTASSDQNGPSSVSSLADDLQRTAGDGKDDTNSNETSVAQRTKQPSLNGQATISDVAFGKECNEQDNEDYSHQENNNSLAHTLRKGWLMLRGRSDNEWAKYWVVLAGLSLKLYKDAWAEDVCSDAAVKIDLTDCESVNSFSAARNYGIEIKCKHLRYVLSALTPGIRDSWIAAMQQSLNVSPVVENNSVAPFTNMNHRHDQSLKKKRIAYVAPESHRRDATCETDGEEEDEEDIESFRSSSRGDELSVSGRSCESSTHDLHSDDGENATYSGASTPRRRRSLSPTLRRSPVSRVKERDTSRRHRSPAHLSARSPSDNRHRNASSLIASTDHRDRPVLVHSEVNFEARNVSSESARAEANVIAMLQRQLETLRQELERTRSRLSETESENERLRVVTNGDDGEVPRTGAISDNSVSELTGDTEAELQRLRKTLQEAERDIWSKQEEIEVLTRKLDYSVNELSDTETILSSSLHDLDNERVKFSSLSEDWSRRVNAMEKQLRDTIRRLDQRERELTQERSVEQHKLKESHSQQRRPLAAITTAEQNENIVAQLEAKLAESEAKVVALTQKLRDFEASSIRDNGDEAGQSVSSSSLRSETRNEANDKLAIDDSTEQQVRFESLRHYCHDQNRRLLATLRNETEFLQTMVETKVAGMSETSLDRSPTAAELKELSDDLIAVHHYIGEMERHSQPPSEISCPDDFIKDFNFKDVLNRLIEAQERFAIFSKREDASFVVRKTTEANLHDNDGSALKSDRVLSLVHEKLHDDDEFVLTSPFASTNPSINRTVSSGLTFSNYWNYSVSVLHADLARSLATYLERKYDDSTHCTVLTSDDFSTILAETMALEACLLTEIANVIEASKNEERLQVALKLRDIRNTFIALRRVDDFVNDAGDDRRILAILENRLDVNFFNVLCEETKKCVLSQLNDLLASFPFGWQKKLRFGPADCDARTVALKELSKNLLHDLVLFNSNKEETTSCATELLRSTILKDEITHILARLETNFDAFTEDSSSSTSVKKETGSDRIVAEAAHLTTSLCDRLITKLDDSISEFLLDDEKCEDTGSADALKRDIDTVASRLLDFLQRLKNSHSAAGAPLANSANTRLTYVEREFQKEIGDVGSMKIRERCNLQTLASLTSARAIVRGYRSWIESCYEADLRTFKPVQKREFDFRGCTSGETQFRQYLMAGSNLAECVAHYEPLTKQLFYRILSNISTKLVAVQLSVFYECRMKELESAHEAKRQRYDAVVTNGSHEEENSDPRVVEKEEELNHWRKLAPPGGRFDAPTNVAGEVAELEQEILEMQGFHAEELEAINNAHAAEVESLRRELATEQERRRKLYNDMAAMKEVTDHSLATLERAHSQLLEDVRDEHRREIQRLTQEYERSLTEEKEATRQALDALQKAHTSELHKQAEKLRTSLSSRYSGGSDEEDEGPPYRHEFQEALHEISRQLTDVSTAYSAKCLENSQLEDKLEETKKVLIQIANGSSFTDEEIRRHVESIFRYSYRSDVLEAELNAKEAEINRCKERIHQLESDLMQRQEKMFSRLQREDVDESAQAAAATLGTPIEPAVPNQNGHGEHVSSSSTSSEELRDEDEDDIAAEYQPKCARRRQGLSTNRRGDSRYHSTPNLGVQAVSDSFIQRIDQQRFSQPLTPDRILHELRNVMGLTVSERRKYFENLCRTSV